jgi:hypothetical protein
LFFSYAEAAEKGVKRAIEAGCKSPVLYIQGSDKFPQAQLVSILVNLKDKW